MMLQQFGGVNEWLEKSASKWQGRVEVQETFNNYPVLYFRNSEDEVNDSTSTSSTKKAKKSRSSNTNNGQYINIGSWQIEHIDNFLKLKLGKE